MKNPLLIPELLELLEDGNTEALREFCDGCHPASVADMISALEPTKGSAVLMQADRELRAEIFSHFDEDTQIEWLEELNRDVVARLLTDMPPDDRAQLFRHLPAACRDHVLPALAQAERDDIRRLSSYKEGTAGSVMTSDYATLPLDITAEEAIERLRKEAPDKETIYYSYVVDDNRRLLGFVSLRDLILANRNTAVRDIFHEETIFARSGDDQEEAAGKIQKYDLIALPIVNEDHILVGIITHDDAIDVVTQEYTEDVEKLMAIGGRHETDSYMRMTPREHFRNRAGWITALAVIGLISGFIVQHYEEMLQDLTILVAFMPMLADTGGNTGSQSATLVIRALALKEIQTRDIFRILFKEAQVALMLALMLGVIAFGRVLLYGGGTGSSSLARTGLAISIALGIQVVSATLFGALLPVVAVKLRQDPAVVASPALTTIVDVTGLLIYFFVVRLILGLS